MIAYSLAFDMIWGLRFGKSYKLSWNNSSLMQKLEKAMLSIGTRLTKVNHCSLVLNVFPFDIYPLSVTFHIKLLDMGSEF